MCSAGDPADAQTEKGGEMEQAPQAGASRYCAEATIFPSIRSSIFCSSGGLWSIGISGLSKRPGDRLETTRGSRLGIRSRYLLGWDLAIGQDMRLEAGFYLRYQRPFLVSQLRRPIDLGRDRTIWGRWKGGWGGDAYIAARSYGTDLECIISRGD